ncbi:hypothetical protein SUDANB145_02231 [Streptomyces sp. enrichment culture]|uniref:hypothetical protein n=1 Tax=Streptomyces sp. enrichment culture TaxID=1795815 RepID=UPI003F56F053
MDAEHADLIAFGKPFLANPDLVRRYRENLPLTAADPATFYGGGEAGYTDYPFHQSAEVHSQAPAADVQHGTPPHSALAGV